MSNSRPENFEMAGFNTSSRAMAANVAIRPIHIAGQPQAEERIYGDKKYVTRVVLEEMQRGGGKAEQTARTR